MQLQDLLALCNLPRQAYESFKITVKPYFDAAFKMAEINMPVPTQPSAWTPKKLPYTQARRMACTHLTMQRFYGESRCPICRRTPDLGYNYLCTQDENEETSMESSDQDVKLAEANAGSSQQSGPENGTQSGSNNTVKLSPWIEDAIARGEYTSEQVAILSAQKQKVRDTIATQLELFRLSENTTPEKSTKKSVFSELIPYLPFPLVNEVDDGPGATLPKQPEARLFPYCEFRACQTCRPTFRDRAWQTFEDTIDTDKDPSIDFENDNRRLSNPYIVAQIGFQTTSRPHLQTFGTFNIFDSLPPQKRTLDNATMGQGADIGASSDIADQRIGPESTRFRDSVKRAFRGMLTRQNSTSSKQSGKKSSRSDRMMRRKLKARGEQSAEDSEDFGAGSWKDMDDHLLQEASTTKLPGRDGMDGLDTHIQEVEVGDGVAVTEEAVDTGTPDVIMSV